MPRRAKLKPQDFERHRFTIGCPGCEQIQLDSPNRKNHTEECRRRMEEALSKTSEGQERLDRAKDRLDTKVAEIGQAEMDKENVEPETETAPADLTIDETPMDQGSPIFQYSEGCHRTRDIRHIIERGKP